MQQGEGWRFYLEVSVGDGMELQINESPRDSDVLHLYATILLLEGRGEGSMKKAFALKALGTICMETLHSERLCYKRRGIGMGTIHCFCTIFYKCTSIYCTV